MAYAMTKRGSQDNVTTYEFICDSLADMAAIEKKYKTIGTIAIVLEGDSGGLEVYICGSNQQWKTLNAGISAGGDTPSGLSIYICSQNEVSNGLPDIAEPDETTVYLVAAGNTTGNLYEEYIYVNGAWEKFGAASIDLSNIVSDVQVNNTSIVSNGVANLTKASASILGLVKVNGYGLSIDGAGTISTDYATPTFIKAGYDSFKPITPTYQHQAVFYGLAKAAGQDMKESNNAVGTYTTEAASAIRTMIGAGTYDKPAGGIPGTDLASGVIPDTNNFAPKADPVFTGSISLGRKNNTTIGSNSCAIGFNVTASSQYSHAEGSGTTASGQYSHAEGSGTNASGAGSHAEGASSTASGSNAHAEGSSTTASGQYSHAEGTGTKATDGESHAEGAYTTASGSSAHSEGTNTVAAGNQSHAEGLGGTYTDNGTTKYYGAYGTADHVEGFQTLTANGMPGNHAEGFQTEATGGAAHSEGNKTTALGMHSHAEGSFTTASGMQAHAEGRGTTASGSQSHAEGEETIAKAQGQHAGGMFNIEDSYASWPEWVASTSYAVGDKIKVITVVNNEVIIKGYICKTANSDAEFTASNWNVDEKYNYVEIVGNGTANNARSNARALDWNGNEHLMGDVYVGCNNDSTGGSKLATESFVTTRVPAPPIADGNYILKVNVSSGTATYSWVALSDLSGVTF